jgi:isopenicillin-N N-acyltransferase-like protein
MEENMSVIKGKRKLKVVEVSGSSYDMGFQYGAACPEISEMLDMTCQLFGGHDKAKAIIKKYVPMYLPAIEKYAPEIVEEMRGIAAGSNVELQDILFLNITYEISSPSVTGGCTAFAAAGEATANGETIAGQNFDYIDPWGKFIIILRMKPTQGPRILAVTAAGCLALFGFNSSGISLNLNLLKNRDSLTPVCGVPTHVILRKIFMCENIGEVIAKIGFAEGRAAKNYLVTDEQGDIIDIETTMNDFDIQYPERGILTHANHFKTDRFKSTDLAYLFLPDAYVRSYRLFQLMELYHGKLTVDILKQLLQDHNNYPNSICRHRDLRAPLEIGRSMKTLISIISCPKEQKAYISVGNPCENEYSEYPL